MSPYIKFYSLVLAFMLQMISQNASAQKIGLLDTRLKRPIIYTDSVSVGQVSMGYIAIPVADFDTLYSNLTYLNEMVSKRQRSKMQSFPLLTNATRIQVSRVPMAYGDRYLISLKSTNDAVSSMMTISDGKLPNATISKNITKMLAYIKSNNSLFAPPKEIHPRIYNVVVISDK